MTKETEKTTPRHRARYRSSAGGLPENGRLMVATFARNSPPIIAALTPWMTAKSGPVLEIGAGSGQHAAAFALAFPAVEWWPSDPDAIHRQSVAAWQKHLCPTPRAVFDLDAGYDWAGRTDILALGALSGVVSLNVIHVAPVQVLQGIVAGAGRALGPGGILVFYGPFRENGAHTGAGNANFDAGLRAENPDWGVRDTGEVSELADAAGLEFADLITMPANNRLLIFRKPVR